VVRLSAKEINQLIVKSQLKIIDCCEDVPSRQNGNESYLSNVEYIYYSNVLDDIYDKFFSEN